MKTADLGYRASEVAKAATVLASTVRYWAGDWGGRLIRPDIEDKRLAGSRKLFSAHNIVQVRIAQVLLRAGFTRARVAKILAIPRPRAGGADWFDPFHPLGQEYALMVIREPAPLRTAEAFMSGDDLKPAARRSWLEAMVGAAGPDFELLRVDFPNGWRPQVQPPLPQDAAQCGELKGARVIWLLNVKKMRDEIRERL
jgi:DNA-binding transcriptional MerR regulator